MKKYFGILLAFMLMMGSAVLLSAQKANSASDFECELNSDGTGVVIKAYKGSAKDVIIPSMIEDFPVVALGRSAFKETNIVSIIIPDSVTEIYCDFWNDDRGCFYECIYLKKVILPKGLVHIGNGTFYGCTSLVSITIPDGVKEIWHSAFAGCTSLTNINIPDSVQKIEGWAFCGCKSLTSITIPDSVQKIGSYAFYECTALTSVTIGDGVKEIGRGAFSNCSSLTTFNVGVKNLSYEDGYNAFNGCSSLSLKEQKKIRDTGYKGGF